MTRLGWMVLMIGACTPTRGQEATPDAPPNVECSEVRIGYYDASDTLFAMVRFHLGTSGQFTDQRIYAPGPDGMWNDADDTIVSWAQPNYGSTGQLQTLEQFTGSGPDGLWQTADDVEASTTSYQYDQNAHTRAILQVSGAGGDGIWGTGDDVVRARYTDRYDATGNELWQLIHVGPGADAIWGSDDDEVGAASKIAMRSPYDAFHYPNHVFLDSGPGIDGVWGNDDDALTSVRTYDCSDRVAIRDYNNPGPDLTWLTADDVLSSQQTLKFLGPTCGFDPCQSPAPIFR